MPISSLRTPLGSRIPWFRVESLTGDEITTADVADAPVVVAFLCNHSPYVRHIEQQLGRALNELRRQGVHVVAISTNDPVAYPTDDRKALAEQARRANFDFPYCLDADQRTAKAFMASCTPEFFLYDEDSRLVYHGPFDESRPGNNVPVSGAALLDAVAAVGVGDVVSSTQQSSFGCSIKWRTGNEPAYLLVSDY